MTFNLSENAIQIDNISKCYHIYDRPRDRLLQGLCMGKRQYYREFWALREISFEVKKGEAFAMIGRNGAGKSTLLQIIAGTLTPTSGSVQVHGRIAALLELGSGFNNEFTGRENVWMNASILGLSQDAIGAKFEEIAAFADIGDFMDQPIKTYSSGMMMRLAFAVQTAIDPAILIVDEALSVGDAFFQAKCMMRLRKLIDNGVTLLFVSHDTATVRQICSRAVLLSQGNMSGFGTSAEVTDQYMKIVIDGYNDRAKTVQQSGQTETALPSKIESLKKNNSDEIQILSPDFFTLQYLYGQKAFFEKAKFERTGNQDAEILNVLMLKDNEPTDVFDYGDLATLRMIIKFHQNARFVNIGYKVKSIQGVNVLFCDTRLVDLYERNYEANCLYKIDWSFSLNLLHGSYCISIGIAYPPSPDKVDWEFIDVIPIAYDFKVAARAKGMIDSFVVIDNHVDFCRLELSTNESGDNN